MLLGHSLCSQMAFSQVTALCCFTHTSHKVCWLYSYAVQNCDVVNLCYFCYVISAFIFFFNSSLNLYSAWHTHTHTRLTALCPGLPRWAGTRKVKPVWILLKQETVSGSGISWAICKSAPRCRQITTPALHHSVFYRPDALPAAQPTASKHWRDYIVLECLYNSWVPELSFF